MSKIERAARTPADLNYGNGPVVEGYLDGPVDTGGGQHEVYCESCGYMSWLDESSWCWYCGAMIELANE